VTNYQLAQYDPRSAGSLEGSIAYHNQQRQRYEDEQSRKVAMDVARGIADVGELINGLEVGIDDYYLRGAYYCRLVELQPALSPVGRLIAERYVEKFKEIV
jgi:hypothetical protein